MRPVHFIRCLLATLPLAACGVKGPLVMPPPQVRQPAPAAATAPPPAPATATEQSPHDTSSPR